MNPAPAQPAKPYFAELFSYCHISDSPRPTRTIWEWAEVSSYGVFDATQ